MISRPTRHSKNETTRLRLLRKRDLRVVPFDDLRVADTLQRALQAEGATDRAHAHELAAVVRHFLEQRFGDEIPGAADVQRQVATVLREMGHTRAADAYAAYREKRDLLRTTLDVRGGQAAVASPNASRAKTCRWEKSKITKDLAVKAGLDRDLAARIAAAVEDKVLRLGATRVSAEFVRVLVDDELYERGMLVSPQRTGEIRLTCDRVRDSLLDAFRSAISSSDAPGSVQARVGQRLSAAVMPEFCMGAVHSGAVSRAHREGRLVLHHLEEPLRAQRILVPWKALETAATAGAAEAAKRLTAASSERLTITTLPPLLEGEALSWLTNSLLGENGCDLALEIDLEDSRPTRVWLRALSRLESTFRRRVVAVICGKGGGPESHDCIAGLCQSSCRVEFAPHASRVESILNVTLSKITINIPQLALRSAQESGAPFEQELEDVVHLVSRGHLERLRFIKELLESVHPEEGGDCVSLARILSSGSCSVGVVGLNEGVKFLTGMELCQDRLARDHGLEIVRSLRKRLDRETAALGVALHLEETQAAQVPWLAGQDAIRFPGAAEIDRGRGAKSSGRYSDGVRWHEGAPGDPFRRLEALAHFTPWIEPSGGLIENTAEFRDGSRTLLQGLLEQCIHCAIESEAAVRGDQSKAKPCI